MPQEKLVLSREDMQKLWEMYRGGDQFFTIANTFGISLRQTTRLCREAATTIGASEAFAKFHGDHDATT